jgi:hypothetical protein
MRTASAAREHWSGFATPIGACMRNRGVDPADGEDVTQEFFTCLLKTEAFEKMCHYM